MGEEAGAEGDGRASVGEIFKHRRLPSSGPLGPHRRKNTAAA